MKRKITSFISLILVLVLCLSMGTTAFASELPAEQPSEYIGTITVADEQGNDVQYELYDNSVIDIPIYAAKEGEQNSRALTTVATLTIGIGDGIAVFQFTPTNVGIALLTVGFTGSFTTYKSGLRYGYNSYIIPVIRGTVSASTTGTGSLSGSYSVLGYETASILSGFSW